MLHEPDARTHDSESHEIVLGLEFFNYLENLARRLIESFDCGQHLAIFQELSFRQNAFGAVLVNVETEDLAAKFALDNGISRPDHGCGRQSVSAPVRGLSRDYGWLAEPKQAKQRRGSHLMRSIKILVFHDDLAVGDLMSRGFLSGERTLPSRRVRDVTFQSDFCKHFVTKVADEKEGRCLAGEFYMLDFLFAAGSE